MENVGLVKFDFLGLTTLSILAKCKEYIDKLYPEREFELERIPVTDEETYRCFQNANTAAVFQFESASVPVPAIAALRWSIWTSAWRPCFPKPTASWCIRNR